MVGECMNSKQAVMKNDILHLFDCHLQITDNEIATNELIDYI